MPKVVNSTVNSCATARARRIWNYLMLDIADI